MENFCIVPLFHSVGDMQMLWTLLHCSSHIWKWEFH